MELTPKLQQALGTCVEALYVIEEATKRLVYANEAMTQGQGADYAGQSCYAYFSGRSAPCDYCPALKGGAAVYSWDCYHSESGCWVKVKNRLVEENGVVYRVGNVNVIEDMMELSRDAVGEIRSLRDLLRQHEQRKYLLEWEADHDRMTRLFNRSRFMRDSAALVEAETLGILYFDINNLKQANDEMGHLYGDRMIKKVAGILEAHITAKLRAYRMGGDEFCVVMQNASPQAVGHFRRSFAKELEELNQREKPVCRVAVGIACGGAGRGVDALMRVADLDMYAQKQRMKNAVETEGYPAV